MKKLASTLVLFACLTGSAVGASAASTEIQSSGVIDLDPSRAEYLKSKAYSSGLTLEVPLNSNKVVAASGGGDFWVVYGFDRHTSNYDHPTRVHNASAGNWNGSTSSAWMQAGKLASQMSYSTLWGNTANYNYK